MGFFVSTNSEPCAVLLSCFSLSNSSKNIVSAKCDSLMVSGQAVVGILTSFPFSISFAHW